MNKLKANITDILTSGELILLTLSCKEEIFSAVMVNGNEEYIRKNNPVWMVFKETEVSIGKELHGGLSIRNRFPSALETLKKGKILSEIILNFKGETITSLITTASCEALNLSEGDSVIGLVKTNELFIMKYD